MSETNEIILSAPETGTHPAPETKLQKFEREQLTRRQAIRKFGFGAGMAALMLLTTDDLAHMVGKKMKQIAGDNEIANTVAKELSAAGMAMAAPPSFYSCGDWSESGCTDFNICLKKQCDDYNKNQPDQSKQCDCEACSSYADLHGCGDPGGTYKDVYRGWNGLMQTCTRCIPKMGKPT